MKDFSEYFINSETEKIKKKNNLINDKKIISNS